VSIADFRALLVVEAEESRLGALGAIALGLLSLGTGLLLTLLGLQNKAIRNTVRN